MSSDADTKPARAYNGAAMAEGLSTSRVMPSARA